jgi:uncharacterized membrane protein
MSEPTPIPGPGLPDATLTSSEFITTMSHFHRAEIARMAGWRDRLDRTTNWALTVAAAKFASRRADIRDADYSCSALDRGASLSVF